ncbi:hypothetical protein HHK36_015316 [Tetracentron sinense]|uniref:Uncharacterized protein n=1 Tax=Tetracentron sinense TaxID=13715 RepID=A0A835DDR4_TETSI|nr:hypothetical protein HHK36_015316 [Tetracentron sinense]
MSSRGSNDSRITEDEINDFVFKLQALIHRSGTARVSSSKILKETCSYIKRLNREVDNLSERLSELMASIDTSAVEADILRSLLMQH